MLAILGGSGCGKTLLLRALAGRPLDRAYFIATGQVSLNQGRFYRSSVWHRRVGFVQRSDELYPKLTVRETVRFAGQLKAGRQQQQQGGGFSEHKLAELLRDWDLERVADLLVEQIDNEMASVGNRKRVAIALHTVHNPDVLFLDEPSVGLDPRREEQLIRDLHAYAQKHRIAVVLSANPSRSCVFRHFDRIMLLCHGQTVYFGTLQDAFWYFGRPSHRGDQSIAEWLTEQVTVEITGSSNSVSSSGGMSSGSDRDTCTSHTPHTHHMTQTLPAHEALDQLRNELGQKWSVWRDLFVRPSRPPPGYPRWIPRCRSDDGWPNGFCSELWILLRRELVEQSRDYPPIIYNILQRCLVFTLLSFLYFQVGRYPLRYAFRVRFGLLIFIPVNQATLVLALLVPSMGYIRPMIVRERLALTYRTSSIYLARVLSEFPANIVPAVLYAFVIYYVTGLRPGFQHFCVFLGVLVLEVYCVMGLGFAVSCAAAGNRRSRDLLTMIVFLTMFMFGGYQVQNRLNVTWVLLWIQYLSPIFYAYSALIRNEFADRIIAGSGSGNGVLREYRADRIPVAAAMGALVGLGSAFFLAGYVTLRMNTAPKRYLF